MEKKFKKSKWSIPVKVVVSISKLKGNRYFLGEVGDDFFELDKKCITQVNGNAFTITRMFDEHKAIL